MKTRALLAFATVAFLNTTAFAAPTKPAEDILSATQCLNHWQELAGSIYSQIQEKTIPEVNAQIIETIQEAVYHEYFTTLFLGHGRKRKDIAVQTHYEIQPRTDGFYVSFVAETLLPDQKPLRAAYSINVKYGRLEKEFAPPYFTTPIPFPYAYILAVGTEQKSEAPGLYKSHQAPVVNGVGNITRSAGVECVLAANVQPASSTRNLENIDSQQDFGSPLKQPTHFLISTHFIPTK